MLLSPVFCLLNSEFCLLSTVHRSLMTDHCFFGLISLIGSIGFIGLIGSFIKTRLPDTCLWGRSRPTKDGQGEAPNTET